MSDDATIGITPASVAALAREWGTVGEIASELGGSDLAVAEGVIHELAHAAVLKLEPSSTLSSRVGQRFNEYKRHGAADRSECAALAVEQITFEALGWHIVHDFVVQLACDDMRRMNSVAVKAEVAHQLGRRHNAERAG